jgi:hypothetical protein
MESIEPSKNPLPGGVPEGRGGCHIRSHHQSQQTSGDRISPKYRSVDRYRSRAAFQNGIVGELRRSTHPALRAPLLGGDFTIRGRDRCIERGCVRSFVAGVGLRRSGCDFRGGLVRLFGECSRSDLRHRIGHSRRLLASYHP